MDPSRKVTLRTNYFKFSWSVPILKYKIDTQPQVPSTQVGLLYRILSRLREPLGKLLETYQPFNFMIYSPTQAEESEFNVNYENVDYKITLRPSGILDPHSGDKEALVFMGRFFKLLQSQLKLKQVGRKYFDDKNGSEFGQWKLTVWPGYQTSLNQYQSQLLINIDTCFKVVRETTVLEFIEDLMSRYQGNQEKINEEIGGMTVMTRYNNTLYAISEVDFSRSPRSTFQMRDGKEISFAEYYETKYNKKLRDGQQPLLVHKRKKDGNPIFLIPELCVLTGQSNEMRQNFQLQKDLARMIKPNPQKRLEESQHLLTLLSQNEKTKEMLKKWSVTPEVDPVKVTGTKIDAGTIILGHGQEFSLEATPDFDRKIQTEMLEQRPLQRIGVFYSSRDREALTAFMDTLKKCVETFNYPMDAPREFAIDGRNYNDWERVFKKELNPTVQAVILILPGKKKSAPFYDDCKRFLLTECPIPSQVVLTSTISAGKNLRSIVNKILIQICAKVGGTPWSISNFPLTDKPTTVIGIDVFHKTAMRKDSLLAYCATMNRHLSRYWSTINQHGPGEELGSGIQLAVKESLIQFKEVNGIYPQRLIVFRDGVAESQRKTLAEIEVKAFHRVFDDLITNHQMETRPEFIFLCVNKRINSKFYTGDLAQQDGLKNPDQGTVIAQDITTNRDFYLISQKTTQGSATPTHYYILSYCIEEDGLYSDKAENMSDDMKANIEMLTYKLCYMYYNWTGAIRIPAPIQYAHKLSNLIGDRWKPHQPMIPHKAFENYKSLYFI